MSVTDNIEKHAGAPLYTLASTHPHPTYAGCPRLVLEFARPGEPFTDSYKLERQYRRLQTTATSAVLAKFEEQYKTFTTGPHYLDAVRVADLSCPCDSKLLYERVLAPAEPNTDAMAYKTCKHTIYAAAKRQMKAAPTPDPAVADDFLRYAQRVIDAEVGEDLTHFGYSYQQWYAHLNAPKQRDMDMVSHFLRRDVESLTYTKQQIDELTTDIYDGICKVEIQALNGKPRMVCAIPKQTKFVMGPVTWRLEEIFQDRFRGYCGGKNLDDMADMVNKYLDQGFTQVVEGDGSAFDNTQDITLKRVDHYIYRRVKHAIHHVDPELFERIATAPYKRMRLRYPNHATHKLETLLQYRILGSVFSGDTDTTLGNTIRMALYNRYVNDKAGLVFGRDYVCFAKGDDFTVMYKPYVTPSFIRSAYYKYFLPAHPDPSKPDTRVFGLGQVLKMLDFGDASILKFCSLRAWFVDAEHIVLTRDPAKFMGLSQYSRKTKTMNPAQRAQYCLDQADAIRQCYSGLHYFEAMAEAYEAAAARIAQQNGITRRQLDNVRRRTALRAAKHDRVQRKQATKLASDEGEIDRLLYAIKYRHTVYNMANATYWEMMQLIERKRTKPLTETQLALVNQQIDAEFSVEELRSRLGPKNKNVTSIN